MCVLVGFLEILLMHVCVHMARTVVAVLVLVLDVIVIVQAMRVHVRHVTVLVLVTVRCVSHLLPHF